ncbi:MAG TPA: DUF5076 domain-containing protein [Pseudorhodoplanes sp.]|jgi:hypothetical protein|nr:DUF5076 domain-containing protein [Pseudorhodoplanes sp.]
MGYNALQIPPGAAGKDGIEVLRAAVIEGGLHVTLRRAFEDPRAWGVLLADVAHQVARVYGQQGSIEADVINDIRTAFSTEIDSPSNQAVIAPVERNS